MLHLKLCEVFRQFLSSFVHHDILNKCTTAKQLKSLDITDDIIRPKGDLFYGVKNERLMKEMKKEKKNDIVLQFQSEVLAGYPNCAKYLQGKLALENHVLICMTSLNPYAIGQKGNYRKMKKLGDLFPQILDDAEKVAGYLSDINLINIDKTLPDAYQTLENDKLRDKELDEWWDLVFQTEMYPHLTLVLEAALSIFTGPMVEGSFSMFNNTMCKKRNSLGTDTYDGLMNVKMFQLSTGQSCHESFKREDPLYSPVDKGLCRDLHFAASRSRKDRKAKLEESKNKLKKLPINKEDVPVDKAVSIREMKGLKAVMSGKPIAPAESVVIQSPVPVAEEAATSVVVEELNNTSSRKRSSASDTSPINEEVIEKPAKKKKQANMLSYLQKQ